MNSMKPNATVEMIKATARKNYSKAHGWQVIVECFSDKEIFDEFVAGKRDALAAVKEFVGDVSARYEDIKATAF